MWQVNLESQTLLREGRRGERVRDRLADLVAAT